MGIATLLLFGTFLLNKKGKIIEAWIKSVILCVLIAYAALEILSLFSAVSFWPLALVWTAVALIAAVRLVWLLKKKKNGREVWHVLVDTLKRNKVWAVLSAGLLMLAILTVPYNWDSMTYHLSRIAMWAQNKSVAHYATNNIRELSSPVLAEFMNLHVYILSGEKDTFVNVLQCLSALTNVWLVYEISRKIGCKRQYACLAAFLCYTSPSMFGEALTTQVDQFASVWLLIFVYYYLDVYSKDFRFQWEKDIIFKCSLMGVCLAFGYLAKPSVLVGAAVLVLVLIIRCFVRKDSPGIVVRLLLCVTPVMAVIVVPEMIRNMVSFGGISTSEVGQRQLVGTLNPLYIFINGLKNFAFNWPNIYLYKSDHWIAAVIYRMAGILGVVINDPSISEDGRLFELHGAATYEPDMAVNAVIVMSFTACLLWGIWRFRKQKNRIGREYALLVAGIFLLFCCVVRWEPFVSRYMISYLALLCPMIAFELEDIGGGIWKYKQYICPLIFFMCCVELFGLGLYHANIIWNEKADRFAGYFHNNRGLYTEYNEVCKYLSETGGEGLGLFMGGDSYVYPLLERLNNCMGEIRHVMVDNESAVYVKDNFEPEYIISDQTDEAELVLGEKRYALVDICRDNEVLWVYKILTEN